MTPYPLDSFSAGTSPRLKNGPAMPRFVAAIANTVRVALLLSVGAQAGGSNYERTYPARMIAAAEDAKSFYAEFRARNEVGGVGHSYITLGTIVATGETQE